MDPKLKKSWLASVAEFQFYQSVLDQLTVDQANFKPFENEWSAAELLEHLYQVDKLTLSFIEGFDHSRKPYTIGWKERRNFLLLRISLWLPRRYKAPKVNSLNPEHKHIDLAILKEEWQQTRNALEHLLIHYPAERLNQFIFKHPYAGKLNIQQAMLFLADHARHHRKQLKKIKSFTGFPTS